MNWNTEKIEMSLQIGDQILSGKDCDISSVRYKFTRNSPLKIEICTICPVESFFVEDLTGTYNPKIRKKRVEDCTIKELLFAVREKVKRGEK